MGDGLKMVKLFLTLALAMSVASQPLDTVATSGAATLSTQFFNWVQMGFEAFLVWARQGFGLNTDEENTTARPRILVVTGYRNRGYTKKTEVWPKPESQCTLPDFPLGVSGAVGFWTAQGPMVCGGDGEDKCFLYKNHQWMPSTNMGTQRTWASAVQINSNQAIIIGGCYDENRNDLKSTELITSTGSEEGEDFPVTIKYHCSFKINSTHALVTGGDQDESRSASTWFVDLTTTTVTPGPKMTSARVDHACSTLQLGRKTFGVVAGGREYTNYLDSTEWIDLKEDSPTWTEGPKLPRRLEGLTLVDA